MLFKSKKVRLFMISAISLIALTFIAVYLNNPSEKKNDSAKAEALLTPKNAKIDHYIDYPRDIKLIANHAPENEAIKPEKTAGSFKSQFKNDLFLGDSITKGLVSYNVLESSNVCAQVGIGINKLTSNVVYAANIHPERIFIMCGINDINPNLTEETFSSDYIKLLHTVKSKFPDSKIYVQSILPVLPKLEKADPNINNSYIIKYNMLLKKIADAESVKYLDTASILNSKNEDLYAEDGLHFKKSFYSLWLNYIISSTK